MALRYFRLLPMGDEQDKTLAFLDAEPIELAEHGYRLAIGQPMEPFYPSRVRMEMQPESPGLKLATLLGNLMGYLIVHQSAKELIESMEGAGNVEYFNFQLANHKGRLHSADYWIVNPLGAVDCLDRAASDVTWAPSDPTRCLSVNRCVLLADRIPEGHHLFRIPEDVREYFIDEMLAARMKEMRFTNVYLDEVEVH